MSFAPVLTAAQLVEDGDVITLPEHDARTHIVFTGSVVGEVIITAQVAGGARYNDVTDGTIDLSTRDYVYIPNIPVKAITVAYDGLDPLYVAVYQFPNV